MDNRQRWLGSCIDEEEICNAKCNAQDFGISVNFYSPISPKPYLLISDQDFGATELLQM